ncbi:MAG: replicative DNA helicase [Firmicutes bacterium]|nr:replicative DNA helicase [Bacillota bacterium]
MSTTKKPTSHVSVSARILPHNIEAEQAVLGCVLIDLEAPITILNEMVSDDFYTDSHKNVFSCMQSVFVKNQPIDYVTLTDELEKQGLLASVGGIAYISTLTNIVPSAANFKHYVEIVKRDSLLRRLIKGAQGIIDNSYAASDLTEALSYAERSIFEVSKTQDRSDLVAVKETLLDVLDIFNAIHKDPNSRRGLKTGFYELDYITHGLQKGNLILIAARPGFGKTSLAMNIAEHVGIKEKKVCAVFNLEMPRGQLAQRSLCTVARVNMSNALNGKLKPDDWKRITLAHEELSKAKIFVDDSSLITPAEMLSKCRRLKREHGLDLVVVDYLQLMTLGGKSKSDNRQQEISEISRSLKILAKELNVPVIALSQLSRAVETRRDHRPVLSDLRESGAIEQDADIVAFIYKSDMYNDIAEGEYEKNIAEVIIAKHRNGQLHNFKLLWNGEYTLFKDLSKSANAGSLEASMPAEQKRKSTPAEDKAVTLQAMDNLEDDDVLKSF